MDIFDLLLSPFYLILVLFIAFKYKAKHEHEHACYKYFIPGLMIKILGAISLGFVYFYYYKGGDTLNYYWTAGAFIDVLFKSPADFYHLYFGEPSYSEYYLLKGNSEFIYWIKDEYAYFASRSIFPFVLLGCKSYIASSILIAAVCYICIWKLYLVFVNEFEEIYKELAYSVLFVPSVVFWGSGLMKDSITMAATALFVSGFYWYFTQKKYNPINIAFLIIGSTFLLSIKPYIFFALLPGAGIWLMALKIKNVKNPLLKIFLGPTIIILVGIVTIVLMEYFKSQLGKYSIEKVLTTAQTSQQDLKQSYYKGNSFDIGDYDPTIGGLASISHKAIFATLFRPTLLDVRNAVMLLSALENTFILVLCLYLIIRLKVYKFILLARSHPLVLFSIIFSIFFALSIGASVSNFGTLVRLKIPCVPFFISSLLAMNYLMKKRGLVN